MPFNPNKPSEFGADNAVAPTAGFSIDARSPAVGSSTVSETNKSDKTGGGNSPHGVNPLTHSLDRVRVDNSGTALTTNQGVAVGDNQNSLKAGLRGPTLLEDFILREKITHFDHERIPERIVHARGSGAHGYFECYKPLTKYTRAAPFKEAGKQTPVFVRFSTVAGERGSVDTARDARGFAVKFYTDEGNWDLVGNNIPVFFIQDAMKDARPMARFSDKDRFPTTCASNPAPSICTNSRVPVLPDAAPGHRVTVRPKPPP